ncbi:octopamine receptor 1-like [Exaiptasia diaphana]|uniref:G-protein coupled receptors family 1 profile domain-containing protein n=1 Tax=Exaiptasia diaphana TaxID=2652724 RepID=A0A913X7C0_EXADI|nr:octopamine receptor 1-like [Exaiptasia diaphana]
MKEIPESSTIAVVIEVTILLAINAVAFFGNFLVCLASFRNHRLRTTTNLYVIALAISDILAACITMPLTSAAIIKGRWIFGPVICGIQGFFVHFLIYASMHTMALTAINRYFRIVKPQKYKTLFGGNRAAIFLALVWILVAFIVGLPPVLGFAQFDFRPGSSLYMCILYFDSKLGEVTFLLVIIFLYVVCSLVVMAVSYIQVSRAIRCHNLQLGHTIYLNKRLTGISVEEIRITKTLFVLVLAFTICWIPVYTAVAIIRSGLGSLTPIGSLFATYIICITSAINPFVYAFKNKAFRDEFKQILMCFTSCKERVYPREELAENRPMVLLSQRLNTQSINSEKQR